MDTVLGRVGGVVDVVVRTSEVVCVRRGTNLWDPCAPEDPESERPTSLIVGDWRGGPRSWSSTLLSGVVVLTHCCTVSLYSWRVRRPVRPVWGAVSETTEQGSGRPPARDTSGESVPVPVPTRVDGRGGRSWQSRAGVEWSSYGTPLPNRRVRKRPFATS